MDEVMILTSFLCGSPVRQSLLFPLMFPFKVVLSSFIQIERKKGKGLGREQRKQEKMDEKQKKTKKRNRRRTGYLFDVLRSAKKARKDQLKNKKNKKDFGKKNKAI